MPVIAWTTWMACEESHRPPLDEGFAARPTIRRVATAPLSAELVVTTVEPTQLVVEVRGPGFSFHLSDPRVDTAHVVPIHGTAPAATITLVVTAVAEDGDTHRATTSFDTPPLPADLPDVHVLRSGPRSSDARWILMPLLYSDRRAALAIDAEDGRVAWLYEGDYDFGILGPTDHGTLVGPSEKSVVEIDWFGRTLRRWPGPTGDPEGGVGVIDAPGIHNDAQIYGDLVAVLTHQTVRVDAYPDSVQDPMVLGGPTDLEDSLLSLFHTSDGSTVAKFGMADRLDTERIFWFGLQEERFGKDWAHSNALIPWNDGWVVSLRHQVALVHLGPEGHLRWILGDPLGWGAAWRPYLLEGLSPKDYPYGQHGPSRDHAGNLLVLDNHNYGYTPYEPAPPHAEEKSRVLAFAIDEDDLRARVAWEWTPPGDLFSVGFGNATEVPGGGVIASFPFLEEEDGVANADRGRGTLSARVFGFDPGNPLPWLDVSVSTEHEAWSGGVNVYRATPIHSFWVADGIDLLAR